ncbi:MAG: hypothetical protein GVY27_13255 [Deinococcus-Thermus bacterium]|jgi:hypothetical protein|nr:hypothetical protein [Deinococcota bacterium]
MTDAPNGRIGVIHILSLAFSGSTWLNLMLGSHRRAFSVGEMKKRLRDPDTPCTVHGADCAFWPRFDANAPGNPLRRVAELAGRDVLVVNNTRAVLPAQDQPEVDGRFVHLVRDGRAVAASMIRKGMCPSMWAAARTIVHELRRHERLLRRYRRDRVLTVRYETLVADPETELRRICAFAGLDFEPGMLEFHRREHHYLGGNRGTLLSVLRQDGDRAIHSDPTSTGLAWDLDYYRQRDAGAGAFRDERWKRELTDGQLRLFALVAGRLNHRYGYPPALERDPP